MRTVQGFTKRWALGCEKFLPCPAWLMLSETGPPFSPSLYIKSKRIEVKRKPSLHFGDTNCIGRRRSEHMYAECLSGCGLPSDRSTHRWSPPSVPLLSSSLLSSPPRSIDRTNDLGQKSLITRTLNRKTLYVLSSTINSRHNTNSALYYTCSPSKRGTYVIFHCWEYLEVNLDTELALSTALRLLSKGVGNLTIVCHPWRANNRGLSTCNSISIYWLVMVIFILS